MKSIKNKWRTLLDHYKKESLIHDKEFKSEWPHFKDMSFLDSKLKQKRCLLTSEANVNNKVLFKFCDIPNNNDDTCESISDLDPSIAKRLDSFNEQLQVIECEKTNIINQSKTDEDIIFLNSLVPNMKKFDQRQKLILRNKIQQFVHDFVFFDE